MDKTYTKFKLPASSNSIDINVDGLKQCLVKSSNPQLCIKENVKVPLRTKLALRSKIRKFRANLMKKNPELVKQLDHMMKNAVMMANKAKMESKNEMEYNAKMQHAANMKNKAEHVMKTAIKAEAENNKMNKKELFDELDEMDIMNELGSPEDHDYLEDLEDSDDSNLPDDAFYSNKQYEDFSAETEQLPSAMQMMINESNLMSQQNQPTQPVQPVQPSQPSQPVQVSCNTDNKNTIFIIIILIYLFIMSK